MDISRLRQQVYNLNKERERLENTLLQPRKMIRGSVYEIYKKCGNKRCKCAHGDLHGPFKGLSLTTKGKRTFKFIRREDERQVSEEAENYRLYQKQMASIRKINQEIFSTLKKIRDSKVKDYL